MKLMRAQLRRLLVAILIPFLATGIQWLLWENVRPFSWMFYYPAAFFAALVGGVRGGIIATLISAVSGYYFFMPPQFSFRFQEISSLSSTGMFIFMGIVFSLFHERARALSEKAARRESEARFAAFMAALPARAWMKDEEGRYALANAYFEQDGLRVKGEYHSKTDFDLFPREVAESFRRSDQNALARNEPIHFFEETRSPDGSTRHWQSVKFPFQDAVGRRFVGGIAIDITQRKEADAALREGDARLRMALEAASMVTWEWDIPSGVIRYSENLQAIVRGEAVAQYMTLDGVIQSVHPDDRERLVRALDRTRVEGCPFECEYRPLMLDGTYRWILGKGSVVIADKSGPVRVLGVSLDITARKQTEEQLRILSRAMEQSSVAVVITDREGNIEHVNPRFTQVTGYSLDEVRGQNPRLLKSGKTPAEEYTRLWQTLTAGRDWHGQFHNKKKNGELFWELASISPLLDESGRITHFVAIKEDITAQLHVLQVNRALARLGMQLSAATTPAEAGRIILDVASELLGWEAGFLHLLTPQGELDPVITFDELDGRRVEFPPTSLENLQPTPMMLEVLRSGGRLVEGAGETEAYLPRVPFGNTARPSACRLFVPIRHGGQALGVLSIQSYTPHRYTEESLRLLQSLADHCAGALERIRSAAALQEEARNHRALIDAIPDTLLRVRVDGTILDAQPGDIACLRRPVGVAGCALAELVEPEVGEQILRHARECLQTRARTVFTASMARPDAEPATAEIRVTPSGSDELLVMLRDITAAHEAERAVIEAVAREQRRIGQDLHDGLGQELASIAVKAKILEETLQAAAAPGVSSAAELVRLVNGSLRLTRQLARGLEPVEVELGNLVLALQGFAAEAEATYRIPCAFACELPSLPLPPATGIHLYRIVQEAIRNASYHGRPKSLRIGLRLEGANLVITIHDDGKGFNPAEDARHGLGLQIMRYRARLIGAALSVDSQPGRGTEVRCVVRDYQPGIAPPSPSAP